MVNDVNFLLWTPLLPGAAAGALEPRHVVVPLREQLDRADLRVGNVESANPDRRQLHVQTLAGRVATVRDDQLVVAFGSVSKTFPGAGLAEHGLGFKTLADGISRPNGLLAHLEIAESLDDPAERATGRIGDPDRGAHTESRREHGDTSESERPTHRRR